MLVAAVLACVLVTGLLAAPQAKATPDGDGGVLYEMPCPAAARSGEPNFAIGRSGLYLSWIERPEAGPPSLRLAKLTDDSGWGPVRTVVTDPEMFVNWADFPGVVELKNGTLAAAWFRKSGKDPYAYDVLITTSKDEGVTWSPPVSPHRDETKTEHGFVTLLADPSGGFWAVWLDGRDYSGHSHDAAPDSSRSPEMELRAARWKDGAFGEEVLLDGRVCDCCQTAGVRAGDVMTVAYRDRGTDSIRDISFIRYAGGRWSEPQPLHVDGWKIEGCPVNGPAMSARDSLVAIAWFTDAREEPRVFASFSRSGGAFSEPVRIDDGKPLGRVDVEWLSDGSTIVTWIEEVEGGAEIRLRRVGSNGLPEGSVVLSPTSVSRASGFPRIAVSGGKIVMAWTDNSIEPPRVRIGEIELPGN